MMREYAESHMDTFIPEIIICKDYELTGKLFELDNIIDEIWGNKDKFYNKVHEIDDESDPIIPEFKFLLESLKENNYEAVGITDKDFINGKLIKRISIKVVPLKKQGGPSS